MIKSILEWLLSFFKSDKKLTALEEKKEKQEQKLKEIEDEELSDDDILDHLNK